MIKLNTLCQIKEKINRAEARDKKLVNNKMLTTAKAKEQIKCDKT
jgi:hypothetical protein